MLNRNPETSPQWLARMAGILYLAVILLGVFSEVFSLSQFIVSGDQAATASNILAAPELWRLVVAAKIIAVLCAAGMSWFVYRLLKSVNKNLMVLAVWFNLVSLALEAMSKVFLLLVLPILTNTAYQKAFEAVQLHAFVNFAIRIHGICFNLALIFFAFTCLIYGYLIIKSGFLPKFIGVLMQVAGVAYLIACSSTFFAPAISNLINPAILVFPLIGEASFCLWLLFKGVDTVKWNQQLLLASRD